MQSLKRIGAWGASAALFVVFLGALVLVSAWILPISNAELKPVAAESDKSAAADATDVANATDVADATATAELMDVIGIVDARGIKAPDFELDALKGGTVKLSGLSGKVVHLTFWATW